MSAVGANNCIHKNSSLSKMFDKESITQPISVVNRRKERKVNDYWNYLVHGELGKERKGHKYYARVRTGTNKLGFPQYRYFYDAREYGAYMTRQKNNRYSPKFEGKKNTTYFVTGKGTSMVDGGTANKDIQRAKGLGAYTTHYLSNEKGAPTGATATSEAKTVKDHPNLRKAKNAVNKKAAEVQSAVKSGKKKINDLILKAKTEHNRNQWQKTYMAIGDTLMVTSKNTKTGEVREKTYNHTKAATNFESTMKQAGNKNKYKYEPIYKANKAYESASRILSNGRKRVQSLFKRN